MASITASLAGLVTFGATVPNPLGGFLASYDLKTFFDYLDANSNVANTPCMLAVPELGEQTGFQTLAMLGNAAQVEFTLDHFLLYGPVAGNSDFTYLMPSMVTLLDNYLATLKATPFLTAASAPSTHFAPKVTFQLRRSVWRDTQYHSYLFRLKLGLNL